MIPNQEELRAWRIAEVEDAGDDERKRWLANMAYEMRLSPTPAEAAMRAVLEEADLLWYPQAIVGPYIVDFICPSRNLVLEVDGSIHLHPLRQERDAKRTRYLERRGLQVIRITNADALEWAFEVISEAPTPTDPWYLHSRHAA